MMADILLSPALQWALIAGALLFAGLAAFGRTRPLHWALPAGLCTAAAVLDALARGKTLEQALTVALATIERIHPGSYEKLIKENAQSAA